MLKGTLLKQATASNVAKQATASNVAKPSTEITIVERVGINSGRTDGCRGSYFRFKLSDGTFVDKVLPGRDLIEMRVIAEKITHVSELKAYPYPTRIVLKW